MNQLMGELLGLRAEGESGNELGAGVEGNPEPLGFNRAIEFQTDFVDR
jgi:hypothetical protein